MNYFSDCPMIAISKVPGKDTFHVVNWRNSGSVDDVCVYLRAGRTGGYTGGPSIAASKDYDAGGITSVEIASQGYQDIHVVYTFYNTGVPILYYKKMTSGIWGGEELVSNLGNDYMYTGGWSASNLCRW